MECLVQVANDLSDRQRRHGAEAPHLIEEVYNLEDALVVAQWLNVFSAPRRCAENRLHRPNRQRYRAHPDDRLTSLLKQTIYYPLLHVQPDGERQLA